MAYGKCRVENTADYEKAIKKYFIDNPDSSWFLATASGAYFKVQHKTRRWSVEFQFGQSNSYGKPQSRILCTYQDVASPWQPTAGTNNAWGRVLPCDMHVIDSDKIFMVASVDVNTANCLPLGTCLLDGIGDYAGENY